MHQIPKLKVSCLVLQLSFCNILKPGIKGGNEDVVGAAPTGAAQTTSEWSTILLPTKARLILEVWQQVHYKLLACHCLKLPNWISLNSMWLKWMKSYKNTSIHLSCLLFYVQITTTYSSKGLLLINQSTHFILSLSSYRARIEYLDAYMHISNGVNTLLPLSHMI